ncbi:hypothetical protein [Micromonospora globispora]|uniref:hypothetical protein n=1 Tax=Micromonospora globispora TaxID=1450148 RepID=UPI000F506AC3|nr:hypothetical protein [Micromonospora globispora]
MEESQGRQVLGLWLPKRSVSRSLLALAVLLLLPAVTRLLDGRYTFDRITALALGVAAGMSFGVALASIGQRRMVERHMQAEHPAETVASKRPW